MRRIILLNKPYNVLPQFSDSEGREHLGHYVDQPGVYPAGRLDRDSEGLMVLTNDGALQHKISHPDHKMSKTYWVQVEGRTAKKTWEPMRHGLALKDANDTAHLMRARHRRLRHMAAQPAHPSSQIDSRYLVNANLHRKAETAKSDACARIWAFPCYGLSATASGRGPWTA